MRAESERRGEKKKRTGKKTAERVKVRNYSCIY